MASYCQSGAKRQHSRFLYYDHCTGHIAWCNIPCKLKSYFLTLRDRFRDKLLSVTAKGMLSSSGNEPWLPCIRQQVESTTPSWLLVCHLYTKKYRRKTNSQYGVVDSTCCRMHGSHGSFPDELNIPFAVTLSNLSRNLSRNVKKYDLSLQGMLHQAICPRQ